jgi:hypothetical protein
VVSSVADRGGEATVRQEDDLTVDALHEPTPHEYAEPVPDEEAG